jgi:hypothetical protein
MLPFEWLIKLIPPVLLPSQKPHFLHISFIPFTTSSFVQG